MSFYLLIFFVALRDVELNIHSISTTSLYNSITRELEAGALALICLLFQCGRLWDHSNLFNINIFPSQRDLCDNPLLPPLLL